MFLISHRMNLIKPSPTLAVNRKAAELKAQGLDIISMGAGEPDFDTPDNIKQAAIKAINDGQTKYTNVDGTPALKNAIISKFKRENDLDYTPEQIIVSNGGKQVLYNLFMASLNDGDEVIIPTPYWVSYSDIVALSGGTSIFIDCPIADSFKLTPAKLESAITVKTKWIILNSPSNPSGAAYSKDELLALARVLKLYPDINILCDDIYEHIIFDDFKFHALAAIAPELKDRIFIVNGVSKSYSMTGWRIGYGAGNKDLIKAMTVIQSQSTSNPCSISQAAAVEALNGTQSFIPFNKQTFQQKRDLALSILNTIPGISCYCPKGAFYLFPLCHDLFGKKDANDKIIANSNDLAAYLLEDAKVAVVPGIAFGLEGYFRISYAMSLSELEEGCLRIKESLARLS